MIEQEYLTLQMGKRELGVNNIMQFLTVRMKT